MLRRRQINGSPRRGARALRAAADLLRWPFERALWVAERAVWAAERAVLWPLRDRLSFGGPNPDRLTGRGAGLASLAALAAAAILVTALLLPGSVETPRPQVAAPTRVAVATPQSQPADNLPPHRELQGVPPSFDSGPGGVAAASPQGDGTDETSSAGAGATQTGNGGGADANEGEAEAASSSKKPVSAGPAAMKVARRFANAFVLYEIGRKPARAKAIFAETASPQLIEALEKRPPRQPSQGAVPRARVVNLVPGPRAGMAYTVSVSLLRVGLTSELRLELSKKKGQWLVTDVRG